MARNSDCTILVASCDAYADVLAHFETFFAKFWPDCPFDVVLVTETARERLGIFTRQVACGKGMAWSPMLATALDAISTPYVVLMMDDYFLSAKVDTANFLRRLGDARRLDAAFLRLLPSPARYWSYDDEFGIYKPNTAYCVSCQVSIWAKDFLRRIAGATTSAWEFERRGSFMCGDETRPFLVTRKREFVFIDAVHKGCWEKFAADFCAANGVTLDFRRRSLPPLKKRIVEALKVAIFWLFPSDWIVKAQNLLK